MSIRKKPSKRKSIILGQDPELFPTINEHQNPPPLPDLESNPTTALERHPQLYKLDDGLIFDVEGCLYRIPSSLLDHSDHFRDQLGAPSPSARKLSDGLTDERPITSADVTKFQMESFLTVLHARLIHGGLSLTTDQWVAVLQLSNKWGFTVTKQYAISHLPEAELDPITRILLGRQCDVSTWLRAAHVDLCARSEPLTVEEVEKIGIRSCITISTAREKAAATAGAVTSFITPPFLHCSSCQRRCGCSSGGTANTIGVFRPKRCSICRRACACAKGIKTGAPLKLSREKLERIVDGCIDLDLLKETSSIMPQAHQKVAQLGSSDAQNRKRHPTFYVLDVGVTFQIEKCLYRIPRWLLKESDLLSNIFDAGDFNDQNPFNPSGVIRFQMDSFLTVLQASLMCGNLSLTIQQWSAALYLSNKWKFSVAREFSIEHIEVLQPGPITQILLARENDVPKWLKPAFVNLCSRSDSLTAEEGEKIGVRSSLTIASIRENMFKSPKLDAGKLSCNGCRAAQCHVCGRRCACPALDSEDEETAVHCNACRKNCDCSRGSDEEPAAIVIEAFKNFPQDEVERMVGEMPDLQA